MKLLFAIQTGGEAMWAGIGAAVGAACGLAPKVLDWISKRRGDAIAEYQTLLKEIREELTSVRLELRAARDEHQRCQEETAAMRSEISGLLRRSDDKDVALASLKNQNAQQETRIRSLEKVNTDNPPENR